MDGGARRRGRIIALEGPSGAGKTTASRRLATALDAVWLPEAYYRLRPRPSLAFGSVTELLRLERRLLDEDGRRFREARRIAERGGPVVADTGFAGSLSYSWGLAQLGMAPASVVTALADRARHELERGRWGVPDRVLWLETPPVDRRARVASDPDGHPCRFADRHEAVARAERSLYREGWERAFARRFERVSGRGDPTTVERRLRAAVTGGPSSPAPARVAAILLERLAPPMRAPRRAGRRRSP
jgi:AAA domain